MKDAIACFLLVAMGAPPAETDGGGAWTQLAWLGGTILAAAVVALLLHAVVFALLVRISRRTGWKFDEIFVGRLRAPARLVFILIAVSLAVRQMELSANTSTLISQGMSLAIIATVAWLVLALLRAAEQVILTKHRIDVADNLEARRLYTQIRVISRSLGVVVIILAVGTMLMTFPEVRQVGASLLASAGIAGLAVGLAARPVLANLIAGVQLALTQPIRIDDVVIVEGEWGWIEEITTTYVVVRIWDLRRLVVPLSHFIEKPFQNWTRNSADILGTVYLYADYTLPVEELRKELQRIVEGSPNWDHRVVGLQITNASEHTVEARALVSSADSSKNWDLRCDVREKLIAFLQREYPQCLPRVRADLREDGPSGGKARPRGKGGSQGKPAKKAS